jgi:hypothetical protein
MPIGTRMYPSHAHSPTHAFTQSSATAHVCAAFAAEHAADGVCVVHAHRTPERSMEP